MEDFNYAYLSNSEGFTVFRYKNRVIQFKAPYSLEHYSSVREWNHGYLVVMAKYRHNKEDEEEYIDLIPVLEMLYIDPDEFLEPIKGVKIETDAEREQALESLYSDTKSEKKAAFARLERLRRKGTETDDKEELAFYRDEKYGR